MAKNRFCMISDDDGYWYLIPAGKRSAFRKLEESGENDAWGNFNDEFDKYRIDDPSRITFTDPEEIWNQNIYV